MTDPPRIASNCLLPVEIFMTRLRCWPSSCAVWNPPPAGYAWSDMQSRWCESAYLALCDSILDFVNLDLTEALDLQQCATSRRVNSLDVWSDSAKGFFYYTGIQR